MARFLIILLTSASAALAPAQIESTPLGAPPAEGAPLGAGGIASAGSIGSTLASLAAVLALMLVCFAAYRFLAARAGGLAGQVAGVGAPAGILDLLGRYPLGRGQTLLLLKVDRRVLLVSQSSSVKVGAAPAMTTLCEITDPDEVSSILARAKQPDTPFRDVIAKLERQGPSSASDGVEVVDLTGARGPFSRLGSLGRKQA